MNHMISPNLDTPQIRRLTSWYIDDVLTLWCSAGFDDRAGLFRERLGLNGLADNVPTVRTRTAARQIHVFAAAAERGIGPADGLSKAVRAFDVLHSAAWGGVDRPGYARVIHLADGTITDPVVDLYDQSCVLLALASLLAATKDAQYRAKADALLVAIEQQLSAPVAGWAEDDQGTLPRRQNPHMHMFEALLALCRVTDDPTHRATLDSVFALARDHLIQGAVVYEYFGPKWELGDTWGSDRIEPGHIAEWIYLLSKFQDLTGIATGTMQGPLFERLGADGRDPNAPFLVGEISAKGGVTDYGRRLWPQAEFIKALIACLERTGDQKLRDEIDAVIAALFTSYLADTPNGTWRDAFDADGNATARSVPASSCYHLWTLIEAVLTGSSKT